MQTVKIITERLASMSYDFAQKQGIALFPVKIMYGDKTFEDDDDAKADEFLNNLSDLEDIPSTGAPPLGEMITFFREAVKDVDSGIYITPSQKLSSIHDHGLTVAKKLQKEGKDIRVFDSSATVSIQGMLAYAGNIRAKAGDDVDTIIDYLTKLRDERHIVEYGVITTLKYLQKNGRIGKAKAWLANLFSFKPFITAQDGELTPVAKVRTNMQGLDLLVEKIHEDMKRVQAAKIKVMYDYGLSDEFIRNEVDPRIKKEFDAEVISYNQISTAIACHLGPEVWGVCVHME